MGDGRERDEIVRLDETRVLKPRIDGPRAEERFVNFTAKISAECNGDVTEADKLREFAINA